MEFSQVLFVIYFDSINLSQNLNYCYNTVISHLSRILYNSIANKFLLNKVNSKQSYSFINKITDNSIFFIESLIRRDKKWNLEKIIFKHNFYCSQVLVKEFSKAYLGSLWNHVRRVELTSKNWQPNFSAKVLPSLRLTCLPTSRSLLFPSKMMGT